ncbi:MAG: hypothetical protein JXR70_19715 [Spirochaetales bacterium]|nr:hypothetical protein [Spirochaetales bacterium]
MEVAAEELVLAQDAEGIKGTVQVPGLQVFAFALPAEKRQLIGKGCLVITKHAPSAAQK